MLLPLLTTIISYSTNIRNVNKEYHTVFIYKNAALYIGLYPYNWRNKEYIIASKLYRSMYNNMYGKIYNRFTILSFYGHILPVNY